MPHPCANNYCSTQYEQSLRHNHTLIRKLLHTNIPGTIIKFITNYINGRKAYTTYRNYTSRYRQFKTGVPQGGVHSPTLFNIYISDLPPPSLSVQVMGYAIDITITYTRRSEANKYIHPYLHKVFVWTKQAHTKSRQNYLHYVHAGPSRIYKQSGPGDPGMSLNCAPTRACRKSVSRPGYVVKVRTDPGYVVEQCPRIVMNKIFDWH